MNTDRNSDTELSDLRASVSCTLLLEQEGFTLDTSQSSRRTQKWRRGAGEIIIVKEDGRGWWDPMRSAEERDGKGDVIRLVQRLHPGMNLGRVRQHLRAMVGLTPTRPVYVPDAKGPDASAEPIAVRWAKVSRVLPGQAAWRYLTQERALPVDVMAEAVRQDVLRAGIKGTTWFVHRDANEALIGAEMRGPDYRGFTKGCHKALFRFRAGEKPVTRLVVCEAAIDALSFAALDHMRPGTLYVSTGGGMGPETLAALRALLAEIAVVPDAKLVIATDADSAGDRFAATLATLAAEAGVWNGRLLPLDNKNDWNAVLQARRAA